MSILISHRAHANAVNEAAAWKERAVAAEARVERLTAGLGAAKEACEHLEHAAGVVDGAQVMALQGELAKAREQIARQDTALRAYETAHLELNDALRTVAEQRDGFRNTVERMAREGAWTPSGVAS